ncbi:hypothetical protein SNEBB_008845 [Seison nebaliae]|nr:hypothetical protein SNEBB_008845 [Seison nebaliae]
MQTLIDIFSELIGYAPFYHIVAEVLLLLWITFMIIQRRRREANEIVLTFSEKKRLIDEWNPCPLIESSSESKLVYEPILLTKPKKYIRIEGFDNEMLNCISYNFLGLNKEEEIEENAVKALHKYGVGSCGPRGFYGTMDVHLNLEGRLKDFLKVEETIHYSYNFSTIASAIPAYAKRGDILFADENCNFPIQQGMLASKCKTHYFHSNNMKHLRQLLSTEDERHTENGEKQMKPRYFVIVEGISMNTGVICDLKELVKLKYEFKFRIFLDESISIGTLGRTGRGVTEHLHVPIEEIDMVTGSMEHCLGGIGGFCAGSTFVIDHQRLSGLGYCFSASLPPILATTAIEALNEIDKHSDFITTLQTTCSKLHKLIKTQLLSFTTNSDELSPIKHLFLKRTVEIDNGSKRTFIRNLQKKLFETGYAVAMATAHKNDHWNMIPHLILNVNKDMTDGELNGLIVTIETVTAKLASGYSPLP